MHITIDIAKRFAYNVVDGGGTMETAILKSISAENFASFAERVVFTCVADGSKKEYAMNTFKAGDDVINKVSYVYGSNGSGKTFFCKISKRNSEDNCVITVFNDEKFANKSLISE